MWILSIAMAATLSGATHFNDTRYPVQDCSKMTNQTALNRCADANFQAADRALKRLFEEMVAKQPAGKEKQLLRASQQAWFSYRGQECAREVGPREGSIWPLNLSTCLKDMTDARIKELDRTRNCRAGPYACIE